MLESAIKSHNTAPATSQQAQPGKKVLQWRENDRMGGKVPVWAPAGAVDSGPQAQIAATLSSAVPPAEKPGFESALAYADAKNHAPATPEEFGFGDLIDMVNPLQHLPVVGYLYRELTGDEIKPIGRIIGGGVYGGFAGIATGLIETVVEHETGKSVGENVYAMVAEGQKPTYRSETVDEPEKRLNAAIKTAQDDDVKDLPGSAISFADLGHRSGKSYERVPAADGRTAGTTYRERLKDPAPALPREPITQLHFDPLPLRLRSEMTGENF